MDTLASLFIFLFEKDTDIISPPFSIPGTTLSISLIVLGILLILYLLKRYSFNKNKLEKRILFGFAFATPFCSAIFVNIYFRKQPYFIYHLTFGKTP